MSKSIESVFQLDNVLSISNQRNKEDILKIPPVSGSDSLNRAGAIRFELNNQQHYICLSESCFVCDFSFIKDDGTSLGADDITLENNWFPRCFNQAILNIGGREIESIQEDSGEISTILILVMTSNTYAST